MSDCRQLITIDRPKPKYPWATDAEVLEALQQYEFHISATAKHFGVKRRELQDRINQTPELLAELADFDEEVVDDAELHYRRLARAGQKEAVAGLLNSKGKGRGYGKQDKDMGEVIQVVVRQIAKE